jgi:hypothetical protein
MKKLIVTLTIITTLCSANLSHAADRYVSIITTSSVVVASIADGEVAKIVTYAFAGSGSFWVKVSKGGNEMAVNGLLASGANNGEGVVIAGPATISVSPGAGAGAMVFLTVKISPNPNIGGVKQ